MEIQNRVEIACVSVKQPSQLSNLILKRLLVKLLYQGSMIEQKLVHKISLIISELFIIEKYVKIGFKKRGYHAIFSVLEIIDQKYYKN